MKIKIKVLDVPVEAEDRCQSASNSTSVRGQPTIAYCNKPADFIINAFVETPICSDCLNKIKQNDRYIVE